jgi:membrane-bound lytic murein transglycosylase A
MVDRSIMEDRLKPSLATLTVFMLCGCNLPPPPQVQQPVNYSQELPPGADALRKLSPDEYPDFSAAATAFNLPRLDAAIDHSLAYLAKPSSQSAFPVQDITHDRAVASLRAIKQLIDTELQNPANDGGRRFDAAIKSRFDIYKSVGAIDPNTNQFTGDVLFTAYFTPTYDASLTRTGPYQWPLYKWPSDMTRDATGTIVQRKMPDGTLGPAYTRQQIEQQHTLDGDEFVWLPNRFQAYIITVQGSARLRLTDGRILEVGNNGTNAYPYVSPGKQMLDDGVITKDQLTLSGLKAYFAAHPEAMDHYLPLNPRDVFFTERPGGPFGSLDEPVTPFGTIATDKTVFPRAMPVFVVAPLPSRDGSLQTFRGIMLDQDTGGAIRSAGRCDIYMGLGEQAGQELNTGQLYYLAVKAGQ